MGCERPPETDLGRSHRDFGVFADIRILNNFIVVAVRGEITMASAPEFGQILTPLYSGDKGIIVDLSGVSAMDSSGVATLVEGLRWRHRTRKAFILVGVESGIYDLFTLTKLNTAFTLLPDPLPDFLSKTPPCITA